MPYKHANLAKPLQVPYLTITGQELSFQEYAFAPKQLSSLVQDEGFALVPLVDSSSGEDGYCMAAFLPSPSPQEIWGDLPGYWSKFLQGIPKTPQIAVCQKTSCPESPRASSDRQLNLMYRQWDMENDVLA